MRFGFGRSLEQPCLLAVENRGNPDAQFRRGFPEAVHDAAEDALVDSEELCQPVLPDAGFPKLKLQIRIHLNDLLLTAGRNVALHATRSSDVRSGSTAET